MILLLPVVLQKAMCCSHKSTSPRCFISARSNMLWIRFMPMWSLTVFFCKPGESKSLYLFHLMAYKKWHGLSYRDVFCVGGARHQDLTHIQCTEDNRLCAKECASWRTRNLDAVERFDEFRPNNICSVIQRS